MNEIEKLSFWIEHYSKMIKRTCKTGFDPMPAKFMHKIEIYSMVIARLNERLLNLLKS